MPCPDHAPEHWGEIVIRWDYCYKGKPALTMTATPKTLVVALKALALP